LPQAFFFFFAAVLTPTFLSDFCPTLIPKLAQFHPFGPNQDESLVSRKMLLAAGLQENFGGAGQNRTGE
jgi:hypothetical protein